MDLRAAAVEAPAFEVQSSSSGTTWTLKLIGELDLAVGGDVDRAVDDALAERPETLVVDLGLTAFISSTGLSSLLRANRHAEARGVDVVIVPGPEHVQRVFRLCGLDAVLPFVAAQETNAAR